MKIYNEIILHWNDDTQKFETIYEDSFNYCPVYLKLMAYDEVNYYKIEDNTEFTIQINGWTEYDMELIVGNMVPDTIFNFSGFSILL